MRRRAVDGVQGPKLSQPTGVDPRSPWLVEALARLEVATRRRDHEAAAEILDGLGRTEEGRWLLRQAVAAGLRDVAERIADPPLLTLGTTAGTDVALM